MYEITVKYNTGYAKSIETLKSVYATVNRQRKTCNVAAIAKRKFHCRDCNAKTDTGKNGTKAQFSNGHSQRYQT